MTSSPRLPHDLREAVVYLAQQTDDLGGTTYRQLANNMYGYTDKSAIQAARQLVYRLRKLGIPVYTRQPRPGVPALLSSRPFEEPA